MNDWYSRIKKTRVILQFEALLTDCPDNLISAQTSGARFVKGVNYGNKFVPEPWMTHRGQSVWGTKYGDPAQLSPGAEKYKARNSVSFIKKRP